jgi:preprotein translocase subunit SecG
MKRLKSVVEEYLKDIGRLEDIKLGPSKQRMVTISDNRKLENAISQAAKLNLYMVAVAFVMMCVLFVVAVFLLYQHRSNIGVSLGGGSVAFAASFGAVFWLHRLTVENTLIQVSLSILIEMPPEQAADILSLLYWGHLKSVTENSRIHTSQRITADGKQHVIVTNSGQMNIGALSVAPERPSDSRSGTNTGGAQPR